MRISTIFGFGLLAPVALGLGEFAASPPVYILETTQSATTTLSKALDTLGYRHLSHASNLGNQTALYKTYVLISSHAQLAEIIRSQPEAKFILPRRTPTLKGRASWLWRQDDEDGQHSQLQSEEDYIQSTRTLFSGEERSQGLLELEVLGQRTAAQAENWVLLCDFLGMGYSVVERLNLWHFPQYS